MRLSALFDGDSSTAVLSRAGSRPWIRSQDKLALGATMIVALLTLAGAPTPTLAATVVDPATLSAPAAPAPIVMACAAGETDLNHASSTELQKLPTPGGGATLSAPAAKQIIEGRPYLQPSDLKAPAVTGITKNHVELWQQQSLVCVTPIFVTASDNTLVPVAPDVCTSAQQADLNDKRDHNEFVKLFGRPTADRVVGGMPYPSVQNGLRLAGVGAGQLKKYDGLICATPYPIRYSKVDWAFATPRDGIAVDTSGEYGQYTLTVPAGVAGGYGSWASVTEEKSAVAESAGITSFRIDAPTVDAHVHGPWTGSVGVTLPPDPTDVGDGYVNTAIHYSDATGPMLYANNALAVRTDGRLTIAVQDLSVTTLIKLGQRWVSGITNAAVSLAAHTERLLRAFMGQGGTAACNPNLTGKTLGGGELFDVAGEMLDTGVNFTPRFDHCITRVAGSTKPHASFVDNRGAALPIRGYSSSSIRDVSNRGGALWTVFASLWNGFAIGHNQALIVGPGDSFKAQPRSYVGQFHVVTNAVPVTLLSAGYYVLDEIGSLLPPKFAEVARLYTSVDCLQQLVLPLIDAMTGPADPTDTLFVKLGDAFRCLAGEVKRQSESLDQGSFELAQRWLPNPTVGDAIILDRLKRAVTVLRIAKYAAAAADIFDVALADGTVTMRWKPPAPPSPAVDAHGRAVVERCVKKTFSYNSGWTVSIDAVCQNLAHGDYTNIGTNRPPNGPPQNAFDDWVGKIDSGRLYNVLERDASGTLHLVLLEGGELVAHPIASGDESAFKADWPEHEWVSDEFPTLIDRIGSPAVNDPLRLRNFTEGRGGSWLLRQADGTAWYVDDQGERHWLSSVAAQQAVSQFVLTLDPAQYAHDVCPYPEPGDTGLRVC